MDPGALGRRTVAAGKGLAGAALLLAAYEAFRLAGVLPEQSAPAVPAVVDSFVAGLASGELVEPLLATAQAWALGLLVAAVVGTTLGAAVGLSAWADAVTRVAVEFLRPIPVIALLPVAIVIFGLQISMQVFLVAIACTWPVFIGTRHAVRAVDPQLLETARSFRLGRLATIRRVVLPAAVPAVATGVRTAAGLGVVVAVAAELVSGSPGLGEYLNQAQQGGQTAAAFAAVLLAGMFGLLVNVVLTALENRVAAWQVHTTEGRR